MAALVWGIVLFGGSARKNARPEDLVSWSQGRLSAAYVGAQLKEIDKTHSLLILSYDVENDSASDYHLIDGPSLHILSRLKSDGSLSQEQPLRLGYPMFLPSGQHARLAIEITEPFAWPTEQDPAYLDKLRVFVKRGLENVAEFVVFDEANHSQLRLPSAWGELPDVSTGGF